MKKIVFVITDYGSFNNFLAETAIALVRDGVEVHVISSATKVIQIDDKFDYQLEGIQIHNVSLPRGFNPFKHYKASKEIHKIIDSIQPDCISIHFTTGIFTATFNKRFKYKTIGTIHGLGFPVVDGFVKKCIYKFVEKRATHRVDQVWVLNQMDFDIIKSTFPSVNVDLLPTKGLGCDLSKFNSDLFDADTKNKLKTKLGIHSHDFVIGFTGRYVSFKGFDKVIKAFKILKDQHQEYIKLILIGGEDQAHPTGLSVAEQQWADQCTDIINIGFTSEVANYLSITDLFVFPSEKEGMPVCIIEALAMNVPVITANARGCNDLISNLSNGILLHENTPDEIAKQIIFLKENVIIYQNLKENIINERDLLDRNLFVKQQTNFFSSNM